MDSSVGEESENFVAYNKNEYSKTISNTPTNISTSSSNIVHKLFNREVSLNLLWSLNLDYLIFFDSVSL